MEDLGSMCMHAGFHPAGYLPDVLKHYEAKSGIPVDIGKVKFYCAHLYARSVIALTALTAFLDPHNPVALNLCYRIVNDRLACEAFADAMDIELEPPAPLELDPDAATEPLRRRGREPARRREPPRSRPTSSATARRWPRCSSSHSSASAPSPRRSNEAELTELTPLLGARPASVAEGIAALNDAVPSLMEDRQADLLRYLYRRACRTEMVYAPIVTLFPDRTIRPID